MTSDEPCSFVAKEKGGYAKGNDKWWARLLKYKINDDLRWKRWNGMCNATFVMILKRLPTNGIEFFGAQMANVLQKLLKTLTIEKA